MSVLRLISCISLITLCYCASTDFNYADFDFSSDPDLTTIQNAKFEGGVAILTENGSSASGGLLRKKKVPVGGFETEFTFRMPDALGSGKGADGFAFVMHNSEIDRIGDYNGGLGYGLNVPIEEPETHGIDNENRGTYGILNSIAIEFDTYKNTAFPDLDAPHISVHARGEGLQNSADETANPNPRDCTFGLIPDFSDGTLHKVKLQYDPVAMVLKMWYDEISKEIMKCPIDIPAYLGVDRVSSRVIAGFTSSTDGSNGETHQIESWAWKYYGDIAASKSTAEGSGLKEAKAGSKASFTIKTISTHGWPMTVGGYKDKLDISFSPPNVDFDITDKDDGTYSVSYTPKKSGNFRINVKYGTSSLKGSPYSVTIAPDVTSVKDCVASGSATRGGTAGDTFSLKIQAKDKFGNDVKEGGERFKVELKDNSGTKVFEEVAQDLGGGKYSFEFTATKAMTYQLSVKGGFTDIKGSPFATVVRPGPFCPEHTTVDQEKIEGDVAKLLSFTVVARDKYENRVDHGGEELEIKTSGPARLFPDWEDMGDGTYLVTLVTNTAGFYDANIFISGVLLTHSPFRIHLLPDVLDHSATRVLGESTRRGKAADPNPFIVQTKDKYGNLLEEGGQTWNCELRGPINDPAFPEVTTEIKLDDTANGQYLGSYSPPIPGRYSLAVLWQRPDEDIEEPVFGSPFNITAIPGLAYGPKCEATGKGLQGAWAGQRSQITITSYDQNGNRKNYGQDTISFALLEADDPTAEHTDPSEVELDIVDKMDGHYSIAYTPYIYGDYHISVKINGLDVLGSPFPIHIEFSGMDQTSQALIGAGGFVSVASIFFATYKVKVAQRKPASAAHYGYQQLA